MPRQNNTIAHTQINQVKSDQISLIPLPLMPRNSKSKNHESSSLSEPSQRPKHIGASASSRIDRCRNLIALRVHKGVSRTSLQIIQRHMRSNIPCNTKVSKASFTNHHLKAKTHFSRPSSVGLWSQLVKAPIFNASHTSRLLR